MNCKYCRANCTGARQDREIALCLGYDPPKTNADRIRSMTDEELAEWASIVENDAAATNKGWLPSRWLGWLRQECE